MREEVETRIFTPFGNRARADEIGEDAAVPAVRIALVLSEKRVAFDVVACVADLRSRVQREVIVNQMSDKESRTDVVGFDFPAVGVNIRFPVVVSDGETGGRFLC